MQFEAIRGDVQALRAILTHIRTHPPHGVEVLDPMPPTLLMTIGIDAADMLELAVPVKGGQAKVQLLITVLGLTINRLAADAGRETLSTEERRAVLELILTKSLIPAFHVTPGCSLVVREDKKETVKPS